MELHPPYGMLAMLQRMYLGGVVGGRSFGGLAPDEVATILRRGETVLTPSQVAATTGTANGAVTINLTVNGSVIPAAQLVDEIHAGLLRKGRRDGTLGFT